MSFTLVPQITSAPGAQLSYNPGMAETFSWIPVEGAGRPLFAKATYSVNTPNKSGFVLTADTTEVYGRFGAIKMITNTVFSAITADNSVIPTLGSITFPANFVLEGPIGGYKLASGSVIASRV